MSEISPELVKQLRNATGAGFMDCKVALKEAEGSIDKAIEVLRKKGLKDIGKRAGKIAAEGTIGVYVHKGEQVVSIVELNCETDFVARGTEFKDLAKDLAMHVAALQPKYNSIDEVPSDIIEKEKEIFASQLNDAQKKNLDKILPGKMEKFYEEHVLPEQIFIKDESGKKKIKDLINEISLKCGEKVIIRRFKRFEVGEGIEKIVTDLASDVQALTSGNL